MANKHCKKFEEHSDYIDAIKAGLIIKYNVSYCKNEKDLHYNNKTDYSLLYFTTEALESGTFSFTINKNLSVDAVPYMSYSIDNGNTWTTVNNVNNTNVTLTTPTVQAGTRVLWKSNSVQFLVEPSFYPSSSRGIALFSSTCLFNVSGNIMSLLYEDNFSDKTSFKERINSGPLAGEFTYMLSSTKVVSAANLILPVTTLQQCCYLRMFMNCTNLTTSPELPATTLASECYYDMFYGCTSLTRAPELPATTLVSGCYGNMFSGCISLATVPELPATTLVSGCYGNMFSGCTSLTSAPELPATTLASSCYNSMFAGCTSLTTAPELPATNLAEYCYNRMFLECTNLTTVPELPAIVLRNLCYKEMFKDCTNLTTSPELPATYLSSECYSSMFYGTNVLPDCSNIDFTKSNYGGMIGLFAGTKVTDNDLRNILPINQNTGNYYLPATTLASSCYKEMFKDCINLTTAPELPATTLQHSCYYQMFYGTNVLPDCSNIDFTSQTVVNSGGLVGLFAGTKVTDNDLRNILPINQNTGNYYLPVTTLASYCYNGMFLDCTSLTTAPELPATTLQQSCYNDMFSGCTNLTTAPLILPATTLIASCYTGMFEGCTSLTEAPELPATTLASLCYYQMFRNCTSLTTAPELPATTLVSGCYDYMFDNCQNLNYIKAMFTTLPSNTYTAYWLRGVASTGTFVKNSAATWNVRGVNGIPSGWTVQTASA